MDTLSDDVKTELRKLNQGQRNIVLKGLNSKLNHFEKTGKLSYSYDICPVCVDMGSTLEKPCCGDCYIKISCKIPFDCSFSDDRYESYKYFTLMEFFLLAEDAEKR